MRIAMAQMFCGWGDIKGNLRRSEKFIRQAAKKGADLVIFPEDVGSRDVEEPSCTDWRHSL